jgi:hypothetical protein
MLESNGSLNWIKNLSESQIHYLDKYDLKKLQIYRYPLLLQDCIKVLEILNNLKSSNKLEHNLLSIRINRHLQIVQLPLIVMSYSEHISNELHVAPKPRLSQITTLNKIIKNFNDEEVRNIIELLKQVDTNINFSKLIK